MAEKIVLFETKGRIAYITLNRPEKLNACNQEMRHQLGAAVEKYSDDDELWCAIITGAGRAFMAGADLGWIGEMHENPEAEPLWKRPNVPINYSPAYRALDYCPKPVIAAVNGYCTAAGMTLALLHCDMRIASDRAVFGELEARYSVVSNYPTPFTWHMSLGNALYLKLTGNQISAETALRMGIVSEVVPHEKLMDRVTELATMVCECAPINVRAIKEFMYRFVEVPGCFGQALGNMIWPRVYFSEDALEGPRAFKEKRKPVWKNR